MDEKEGGGEGREGRGGEGRRERNHKHNINTPCDVTTEVPRFLIEFHTFWVSF